jgi:hypothetical protein
MAKRPKRFYEGGMDEKEPGWESKEAPAVSPKSNIVTKEQLAESGLSLRDYMNKQQGLTRRGEPAPAPVPKSESEPETKSVVFKKETVKETPKESSKTVTASSFDPDSINFGGTKVEPKKEPAERKYTQTRGGRLYDDERTKKSSSSGTSLFGGFGGSQRNPKKMATGGKVSSASSRADGIATKGKTRGRMC